MLFPGCLVFARFQDYELSARVVLARLGIELVDMHGFACCASSVVPPFSDDWINLPAYNLALAESRGMDIVTLCGSCTRTLRLARQQLAADAELLEKVNRRLASIGLTCRGNTGVSHIIELLSGRIGDIAAAARHVPDGPVALSHPCNIVRPGQTMRFDDPWQPRQMRRIVEATGADVAEYVKEYDCCGATLMMVDEHWAADAARAKLRSAMEAGARLMAVACGNCFLALGRLQSRLRRDDPGLSLPVMFLPQLVGLSFGIGRKELGLA